MHRKIIHIDMDCFYAAVEIRDNPDIRNKPVAIGGPTNHRGVLSTCNYEARKYGLHSAMSTTQALERCPSLILIPVDMNKYRQISQQIHQIFQQYTDAIEPISLDEAYLDVTLSDNYKSSATLIAEAIRSDIYNQTKLTASAGVSVNKFLAKVASDWKKPNGLFTIPPESSKEFIHQLPITLINGVGRVTAKKLNDLSVLTCGDLLKMPEDFLHSRFGKLGLTLLDRAKGIDNRPVRTSRQPKSKSVETTFPSDIQQAQISDSIIAELIERLSRRLSHNQSPEFDKIYVKIKFSDFSTTTVETLSSSLTSLLFMQLIQQGLQRRNLPIRLLGIGVRFKISSAAIEEPKQESLQLHLL